MTKVVWKKECFLEYYGLTQEEYLAIILKENGLSHQGLIKTIPTAQTNTTNEGNVD